MVRPEQLTVQELRREGICFLQAKQLESPAPDAGLLLMHVLDIDKTRLLISNAKVTPEKAEEYRKLLERRAQGEPVQYLLGHCEFMSLDFRVNRDTLIPRPDTEVLVEWVIRQFHGQLEGSLPVQIMDIGTGSGCIAVSMAYYIRHAEVTALDISDGALRTAQENAALHSVQDRITFFRHDILKGFPPCAQPFDCIVSNPPYITKKEMDELEPEVGAYEPRTALYGGRDGLTFYRTILREADKHLRPGGLLAFEIGYRQARAVKKLFEQNGQFETIQVLRDLAGRDRVVAGKKRNSAPDCKEKCGNTD